MKPKHQRLIFVSISVIFLCVAVLMIMRAFRENLVFFYSPSDLAQQQLAPSQRIRIGGLVKTGSVSRGDNQAIQFIISDGAQEVQVHYTGLLPNLFREEQGVIAEGYMQANGIFQARTILAKHDENYMPKEVVDALKKSGQWKGESGK